MSAADENEIDLSEKFPDLEPIHSPPPVWSIFGFGLGLYGSRDADQETSTYVKTHSISALGIPIFALAAYRIAETTNGVYILGRQPLSPFAKIWNYLFLSGILTAVAVNVWTSYTNSPDYLASRKLADAGRLLETGELTQAARLYRDIAVGTTSHQTIAREKFTQLLNGPMRKAAPADVDEVLQVALEMHEQAEGLVDTAQVLKLGTELVEKFATSDPGGALTVLEALAPLAEDADVLVVKRQKLLETMVQQSPNDPEAVSRLALVYETQGEMEKCERLLLPHRERLGIHEGARILGQIFSNRGLHDKAVALLLPYTEGRLERLHAAEKAFADTVKIVQTRIIHEINSGKAPQSFYERARELSENEQDAMAWEYVQSKLKDDPRIKQRQQALLQETPVVPVAIDLGIALLQRAQGIAEPDKRRSQLEKAKQIFLSVRGLAGDSDAYRLSLGQVYYWLGKQVEGRELFDKLLDSNERKFELLMAVSHTLRNLGLFSDSRTLSEEAYTKGRQEKEKQYAAALRALTSIDLDDKLIWLRRSNQSDPQIQAELSSSKANQAIRDGKDELAIKHLQRAIDIYASQTENEATLNNAALAYFSLFRLTGDPTVLDQGTAKVEQALAINPSDSILLLNAASAILEGGIRDIIGDKIDLKLLKMSGSIELLPYLYREQSDRQPYIERLHSDPRVEMGLKYLQKVLVLAPKRSDAYKTLASIHAYTRDTNALRDLLRRIVESAPDLSSEIQQMQEYYAGTKDETLRQSADSAIIRSEGILSAANAEGGVTLAIAKASLAGQLVTVSVLGRDVSTQRVLDLAEQAYEIAPSVQTHSTLVNALCFRASRTLAEQEPAYAEMLSKAQRSLSHRYILAASLSEEGPLRKAVLANPDFQHVATLLVESIAKIPDEYNPRDWAILRADQSEAADSLAESIKQNEVMQVMQKINLHLSPASGGAALSASWAEEIAGDDAAALDILRRCADRGVPLPFDLD